MVVPKECIVYNNENLFWTKFYQISLSIKFIDMLLSFGRSKWGKRKSSEKEGGRGEGVGVGRMGRSESGERGGGVRERGSENG